MRTRRRALTAPLVLLAALLALPGGAEAARKSRTDVRARPFRFTAQHVPADFTEPSAIVTRKGTVLFCGPLGLGDMAEGVVRSTNWKTFESFEVSSPIGGGGDCDIKQSPDGTLYLTDLQAFGATIHRSTDDGATWEFLWQEPIEEDRQWLATDPNDPNVVYLAYHDLTAEAEIVSKSTDGGQTFVQHAIVHDLEALGLLPDTFPNTFSGPIRVDPSDSNRVYLAYGISSLGGNAHQCVYNTGGCPFGDPLSIVVASSADGGATWTNKVAMGTPFGHVLGNIFPWLTVDRAGNVYAMAAGHIPGPRGESYGAFVSVSKDHGRTWSQPLKINRANGATVFPTMVAGDAGIVDFAWVEASTQDQGAAENVWRVHFAQSRNMLSARPTFVDIAGPVMRRGNVCTLGINCTDGRELGDFFEISLDAFGYAHIAVSSTEPEPLHILYWRQDAGPSAYGRPCRNPSKPRGCAFTRPFPGPALDRYAR
jgi:hypothetical protein